MTPTALSAVHPKHRARIEALLARKWQLPGDHPIARLDGVALGDYRTIAILGPKNAVGSRYYQLFLADASGHLADGALALGLHNSGPYPAFNWIEMTQYNERPAFSPPEQGGSAPDSGRQASSLTGGGEEGLTLSLFDLGLDRHLFSALASLVPSGGHLMAEYDSPSHVATERILTLRYPIAASPIGFRLFEAGVRSYRDWYISEGGREGPRKLQGFIPLNNEIAKEKTAALHAELENLLSADANESHGEWGRMARDNARSVLQTLR